MRENNVIFKNKTTMEGIEIWEIVEKIKDSYVYSTKPVSSKKAYENLKNIEDKENEAYIYYKRKEVIEGYYAIANLLEKNKDAEFYAIQGTGYDGKALINLSKILSKINCTPIVTRINSRIIVVDKEKVYEILLRDNTRSDTCNDISNSEKRRMYGEQFRRYTELGRRYIKYEINKCGLEQVKEEKLD